MRRPSGAACSSARSGAAASCAKAIPKDSLAPPTPPRDDGFIDFSRNFPTDHGQGAMISAALGEVARSNQFGTLLGYATTTGMAPHREAAAAWIRRDGFRRARGRHRHHGRRASMG
jgi:DNA-binding transcriptional MocR family regulator